MSTDGAENESGFGSEQWWQNYLQLRESQKAEHVQRLKAACPALASLGVANIIWHYDGYGDSSEMTNIEVKGGGSAPKSIEALKKTFKGFDPETQDKLDWKKLENAVWYLMPDGFENNEGGFGAVDLNVTNSTIQVRHNQRVEETVYEEENF